VKCVKIIEHLWYLPFFPYFPGHEPLEGSPNRMGGYQVVYSVVPSIEVHDDLRMRIKNIDISWLNISIIIQIISQIKTYIYIINYKSLLILTWGVESISCGNLWNTGMSPGLVVDFRAPCPHPTNWKHRNAKLFDIQRWMPKILQIGYYQWEIMGTPMVWGTILELYARSIGWSLHVVYIWKHSPFVFACPIGKA
jgi:hypothetical protein